MKTTHLNSGDLARAVGVNKETLRFYERKGILRKPERTEAGYRLFDSTDVERLTFIKKAKSLGFSLGEIKELLAIADGNITCRDEVKSIAKNKLKFIDSQIESLNNWKRTLSKLLCDCEDTDDKSLCPIIEDLSKGESNDWKK
ncbi:MAG: heavy metal-responsive transcriptional regulator [candidate division Zixibacteria bacterium]|nr:heavy metal-responsive transcriptional regulator [candidate division Zixibacteria bacterium]